MAFGKRENVCWLLQVSGLGQTDYLDRDDYQDYNDDDGDDYQERDDDDGDDDDGDGILCLREFPLCPASTDTP